MNKTKARFCQLIVLLALCVVGESVWSQSTAYLPAPVYQGSLGNQSRKVMSISLQGSTSALQTITCGEDASYMDKTAQYFTVQPGETLTASFTLNGGNWINGYVYIDDDNDGTFTYTQNNATHTAGGELKAYSYYCFDAADDTYGYNNQGNYIPKSANLLNPPSFQAPAAPGIYHMRFKTDWNEINPIGGNQFQSASGVMIDVKLRVQAPNTHLISSLSEIPNNTSDTYILTADCSAPTSPITGFTGTFDGGFHTVSGLDHPLFETLDGATVKNVILDQVHIAITTSNADVGAIANTASGNARIYNCGVLSTDGTSSISGTRYVGSIVGALSGNARVLNCFSYANVSGGTNAAGIVGSNGGTAVSRNTILGGTGSMVFNCMFFGQIVSGTNKYPIYGGTAINNVSNINTYNYYIYSAGTTYASNATGAAGVIDKSLLTRFDMYRGILNSHRDLCARYIYNTQTPSAAQKNDIALWLYDHTQKETIPYLQLEKLVTNTRRTINRAIPSTTDNFKGKEIRRVSCTFIINGSSYTESLPITDMDTSNYDYTWGKIILPFANEFSGWSLPASGSNNYDNIITGWEITSIVGGTAGSWDGSYNMCDPDCTAKDLYANNDYVWAQGGNYVVPTGVSSITFTAHIARAVYLADSYVDIAYNNAYTQATNLGTQISGDTYNGKTVYHTLPNAYAQLQNLTNPADQAVVLVGNFHENQQLDGTVFVDSYYGSLSADYSGKAATFMSIDADNNQVPDYAMPIFLSVDKATKKNSGRTQCPPIRFDFLCCPGMGISSYTRAGYLADVDIIHSKGWLEFTETCMIHTTEFEIRPANFSSLSPVIINGGIHEKLLQSSTNEYDGNTGDNNNLSYIRVGGKAYMMEFWPGYKNSSVNMTIYGKPINVSGGQIDECYTTSDTHGKVIEGDVNFYCNGGYIKEYLGAYQERITGNSTVKIDHALIDYFYGGGNDNSYGTTPQIGGDIVITINNSYVKFYCAGPKFGTMGNGKTVTTHAKGTTFREYYGAGYGGTALTKDRAVTSSPTYGAGDYNFPHAWTNYTNKRLFYNSSLGTGVGYSFRFFMYAGGNHQGNAAIYVDYATLSLASTKNVSSTLDSCTIETSYYGGGCQGMVDGTITNILTNCNVVGSVFGGGYKASATPIYVYPTDQPTYATFKAAEGLFTEFGTTEPEVYHWLQSSSDGVSNETAKTITTTVNMADMGKVTGNISLTINGGTVGANVYGGGNESPSAAATSVLIAKDVLIGGDVFGGGNVALVGKDVSVTFGEAEAAADQQPYVDGAIYGGGALANTNATSGNTSVALLGGSVADVYGGGLGCLADGEHGVAAVEALVGGNTTVTLNGSVVRNSIFGSNNLNGTVQGHVFVDVKKTTPREGQVAGEYDVPAVYGGGNQADYVPANANDYAEVLVENCTNSIAYVYGGGNAAAVPKAAVTIQGGSFDYVFAGGNGAGVGNPGADVGYRNHTAETYGLGTAEVNVHGGVIAHLFAGSNERGRIREGQSVSIDHTSDCAENVREVYGGGNLAPGKAGAITVGCGSNIGDVYGGANNANVVGDIVLNITGGNIGNVFGGNNTGGSIDGSITVNVDWDGSCGSNSLTNVYGGGNQAAYDKGTHNDPVVNIRNATIEGDVFGGGLGELATMTGNPQVNVNTDCTNGAHTYDHKVVVKGSVYGGGSAAPVVGAPVVYIKGLDTDNKKVTIENYVFGGGLGATATVSGDTDVTITGNTEVKKNVYGGGNGGEVGGDTHVVIGESCTPAP